MTPPYVVFAAVDGLTGGGGGPFASVSYTVVDSTNTCVPNLPAEWVEPLAAADTLSSLQTNVETGLTAFLQANYGLSPTDVSYTWLT